MSAAWEDLPDVVPAKGEAWEALPDVAPSEPAPEPSMGASALAGVQQLGTFMWGDELGAAMQGGLAKLTGTGDFGETYRQARGENRAETKAAKAAHPNVYLAAGLPAALAASAALPALKAGQGASLLARALYGGANGLVQGITAGAGDSDADTLGGVGKDAATGGLVGGGLGAALPLAGAGLRAAFAPVGRRLAGSLEETAIGQGRRVLLNGADSLSTRNPVKDASVAEAIRSGAIKPFGNTKGAFERLQGLTEEQVAHYDDIVSQLADKGMHGPEAEALAQKLLDEGGQLEMNTMNDALPAAYLNAANQVAAKAESTGNLGLKQAINLTRSLQNMAKYGRPEETPLNSVRRDIASTFRQGIEDAVDSQAAGASPEVQELAGQFVPTKQRLSRLIDAEGAAERGASRVAKRSHFGAKDILAATVAAGTGHGLVAGPVAIGSHFLSNRVPSAVASYGLKAADALRGEAPVTGEAARRLQALILALRGPSAPIFLDGGSISTGPGGALAQREAP